MVVPGPDLARTYLNWIPPLKLTATPGRVAMQWIVIALVLLAAFGPVLWLLPSARDRRLTKLRGRARSLGLEVEISRLPDLAAPPAERVTAGGRRREPMLPVACYRLPSRRKLNRAPQWRALRGDGMGPVTGWQWDRAPAGSQTYWEKMAPQLTRLPSDALGCAADAHSVACWWREQTPQGPDAALDSVFAVLVEMLEIHRVEDEMIRAAEAARAAAGDGDGPA
jgi:hypothetical protein